MRIVLDARWILPEPSGIGMNALSLIEQLPQVDAENEYVLLFNRPAVKEELMSGILATAGPRFSAAMVEFSPFSPATQLVLPKILGALKADLFHSLGYMVPLTRSPCPVIATVHDLIPLVMPEPEAGSEEARRLALYRTVVAGVSRRARCILTCSDHSRRDILRLLEIAPDDAGRVVAVTLGVSPDFRPAATQPPRGTSILYVGRPDPHKNLVRLVEAFAAVRRLIPAARLRIIGPHDPRFEAHRRRADALGVADGIDEQGCVPLPELVVAYQQAAVFAFPSLYEGFGLPVLEAMACGTPVVCSRAASLSEVAGDAALMIDPDDVGSLEQSLIRVLTNAALADSLRRRGLRRARLFSWRRSAELTCDVYRRLMARPVGQIRA